MRRRELLACIGGLLAAPLARAQRAASVPRIGYLFSFARPQGEHLWEACRQGLRELGYAEGRNIVLEPRWADGRHDRMPALVAELVALKIDIIVAAATPANLAARAGGGSIPVVMVAVSDPARIGLVDSLARPGGRITGISLLTPELSGKRLELLLEIAKQARRVATLVNPDNRSHQVFLDETRAAAGAGKVELDVLEARNAGEIERAFQAAVKVGAQGLIVFDDPVLWGLRKQIVALAAQARLPAVYGYSEFVDEGGLVSYGPHRPDLYRRTAAYVDRILKGANPAEMPIERPTRFELFVNAKTAGTLGLALPQSVLVRADRVIE
ncbi:MAG: ABC transporter substrate-binding protein [Burkholderiales bacterium]|nr:ABC transporter substrate-binding protein [Burkholderiales bacterium]